MPAATWPGGRGSVFPPASDSTPRKNSSQGLVVFRLRLALACVCVVWLAKDAATPARPRGEVYQYRVREIDREAPSERISRAFMENRGATAAGIASRIRVDVTRTPIRAASFVRVLDELKTIQLSPLLANRICLDDYPMYEFWQQGDQESVYYALHRPSGNGLRDDPWPQGRLGRWMISVQTRLPELLKEAAEQGR